MRKKSMRLFVVAIAMILVLGIFAGCGTKSEPQVTEEPAAVEQDKTPAPEPEAAKPEVTEEEPPADSDLAYIKDKGAIKIGITIFDPMNYYDDGGTLVGFDTEFAVAVCEQLGVAPDFVEINWDTKEIELASKSIDCIWNGLTVTEERRENMFFTDSYIKNMQVIVIRAADKDKYTSIETLAEARLCAEMSSAGETAIQENDVLAGANYTALGKQTDTLMEVKAGTSDAAVLDYTAAKAMVGEGTNYSDLMILPGAELEPEEYAIGFRLESDIVAEVNKIIKALISDGTLNKIAETYDLTASLLSNQ